jgi:hypothetical protein
MSKLKETPSGNFEKELERMYVRTEHWISDYQFFEDECRFLINLMDKYLMGTLLADDEKNGALKDIIERLLKLDASQKSIAALNKENLSYLAGLIQNKEIFDPEECRDRQSDLESDHTAFLRTYRAIKKEVFQLSEKLLASARQKNILEP